MEILWKGTFSPEFRANNLKLCGIFAFPQNFYTKKLGEITIFYAVAIDEFLYLSAGTMIGNLILQSLVDSNSLTRHTTLCVITCHN